MLRRVARVARRVLLVLGALTLVWLPVSFLFGARADWVNATAELGLRSLNGFVELTLLYPGDPSRGQLEAWFFRQDQPVWWRHCILPYWGFGLDWGTFTSNYVGVPPLAPCRDLPRLAGDGAAAGAAEAEGAGV